MATGFFDLVVHTSETGRITTAYYYAEVRRNV